MPTSRPIPPNNEDTLLSNTLAPLSAIRTETVFSRLPIHNLAKKGKIDIQILRKNDRGEIELRWEVSHNERYGQPRQLAYKLDTIVINRKIDELAKPLPPMICLGSLHAIAEELGLTRNTNALKKAILQNVGSLITVKLRYIGIDDLEHHLDTSFNRYGVVFTGQQLPDGTKADAVYLTLNAQYRAVLNNAPTRPLDYEYLKALAPAAQRFYEIMSYKMFAAIKYRHTTAKISYSEYCTYSAQQRYEDYEQVKKQMYKVHRPHLQSGYLKNVACETTINRDGERDWTFHYTPGPKARAEFKTFNDKRSKNDAGRQALELEPEASETDAPDEARDLVQYFHRRFDHGEDATPEDKDLKFAEELIAKYGMEKSRFVVEYSQEAAAATKYSPDMLIGIRKYVEAAAQKFDAREKNRQEEKRKAREEDLKTQYERYLDQEIERMKSTMSPDDLAEMESSIRADLSAQGVDQLILEMKMRIRRDKELADRADVLPYAEWRKQQA